MNQPDIIEELKKMTEAYAEHVFRAQSAAEPSVEELKHIVQQGSCVWLVAAQAAVHIQRQRARIAELQEANNDATKYWMQRVGEVERKLDKYAAALREAKQMEDMHMPYGACDRVEQAVRELDADEHTNMKGSK